MKVNLGEVTIEIVHKPDTREGVKLMNCTFTKGFSKGKGSREVKNFYFYLEMGKGLIFKAGMEWAPHQLKDYMNFLKGEYLELEAITKNSEITSEEFLGFLVSKRRIEIIDGLNEE
jgi:hypothetical protein